MKPTYRIVDNATWWFYAPLMVGVTTALGTALVVDSWAERRLATACVLAGFWGGVLCRYLARWRAQRSITFTLATGTDVWGGTNAGRVSPAKLLTLVLDELAFWDAWAKERGKRPPPMNVMDGGSIVFVDAPFVMRMTRGLYGGAAGGNNITVAWLPDEPWDMCERRLVHEMGHVCLGAIRGYVDEAVDHHELESVGKL